MRTARGRGESAGGGGERRREQIRWQRVTWPALDLDLCPRSSWVGQGMKTVRALSLGLWREGGQGKRDSGSGRDASGTAVPRRLS